MGVNNSDQEMQGGYRARYPRGQEAIGNVADSDEEDSEEEGGDDNTYN